MATEADGDVLGGEVDHVLILPEPGKSISFFGLLKLASFHHSGALNAFPQDMVESVMAEIDPQVNQLRPEEIQLLLKGSPSLSNPNLSKSPLSAVIQNKPIDSALIP